MDLAFIGGGKNQPRLHRKAGPYKYAIPFCLALIAVALGYPAYKKVTQYQMADALSVTVENTLPVGAEKTTRSQIDKVFNLACENYWILKYITPEERERAKGILLHPYYTSPLANSFADASGDETQRADEYIEDAKLGKFSGFSPGFRGFYWQARLDSLSLEDRRRLEWVMRPEDRTAVNEVRELRESLKELFYLEFNASGEGTTAYTFQICNNRSQPLKHVEFWVSGFHRGGISPQSLGRGVERGSSTQFESDQEIPAHQCATFTKTGDYRLFDNFEVNTAVGSWPDRNS